MIHYFHLSWFLSFFVAFMPIMDAYGQTDIPTIVKSVVPIIEEGNYSEAYNTLLSIDEKQIEQYGDSCVMMFNYEKGTCLFFLNKYEDAIPYINKALTFMEKMPHEDCNYLELIYGLGSCYKHLKQYENAEKYFRRVIIRGNVQGFMCAITTQTLSELTEVYNKLGYKKLAEGCAAKIQAFVDDLPTESWSNRMESLLDLANSYEEQGKIDEEIDTYHKILNLIESSLGKENEDYLKYSSILYKRLLLDNRIEDVLLILEDIIGVGNTYKTKNKWVCNAYEYYLEIKAKQNETETVEKVLPNAIKYIRNTIDYDWQNKNLYEMIGNAFSEAGNCTFGAYYLGKRWNGKLPHNIRSLGNLALCFFETNPQKSLSLFKESEILINDSTNAITKKIIYENMYLLYSRMNQYDEAVRYAELAAPYIKEIEESDNYALHLIFWAIDCSNANQNEKGIILFEQVKDLLPSLSEEKMVFYHSQYGYFLLKCEEYEEAIKILKKGINLCNNTFGEDHAWLYSMYHNLGRAYMLYKDYANAILYLNKSKDLQIQLNGKVMQRTLDYIKECEAK